MGVGVLRDQRHIPGKIWHKLSLPGQIVIERLDEKQNMTKIFFVFAKHFCNGEVFCMWTSCKYKKLKSWMLLILGAYRYFKWLGKSFWWTARGSFSGLHRAFFSRCYTLIHFMGSWAWSGWAHGHRMLSRFLSRAVNFHRNFTSRGRE